MINLCVCQDSMCMQSVSSEIDINLQQAIAVLNHKGEIIYVTDLISAILGYEKRDLICKSAFLLLPSGRQNDMKLQYEWILACRNRTMNTVLPIKHKTGSVIRLALTIHNLCHCGDIKGVVITIRI
jgi:PAS domain S-box-containing protein